MFANILIPCVEGPLLMHERIAQLTNIHEEHNAGIVSRLSWASLGLEMAGPILMKPELCKLTH